MPSGKHRVHHLSLLDANETSSEFPMDLKIESHSLALFVIEPLAQSQIGSQLSQKSKKKMDLVQSPVRSGNVAKLLLPFRKSKKEAPILKGAIVPKPISDLILNESLPLDSQLSIQQDATTHVQFLGDMEDSSQYTSNAFAIATSVIIFGAVLLTARKCLIPIINIIKARTDGVRSGATVFPPKHTPNTRKRCE